MRKNEWKKAGDEPIKFKNFAAIVWLIDICLHLRIILKLFPSPFFFPCAKRMRWRICNFSQWAPLWWWVTRTKKKENWWDIVKICLLFCFNSFWKSFPFFFELEFPTLVRCNVCSLYRKYFNFFFWFYKLFRLPFADTRKKKTSRLRLSSPSTSSAAGAIRKSFFCVFVTIDNTIVFSHTNGNKEQHRLKIATQKEQPTAVLPPTHGIYIWPFFSAPVSFRSNRLFSTSSLESL